MRAEVIGSGIFFLSSRQLVSEHLKNIILNNLPGHSNSPAHGKRAHRSRVLYFHYRSKQLETS